MLLLLIPVELGASKKRNSASSCRCAILRSTLKGKKKKKSLKKFQFYLKGGRKEIPGQQLLVRDLMGGLPWAPSCPKPRATRKSSCGGYSPVLLENAPGALPPVRSPGGPGWSGCQKPLVPASTGPFSRPNSSARPAPSCERLWVHRGYPELSDLAGRGT